VKVARSETVAAAQLKERELFRSPLSEEVHGKLKAGQDSLSRILLLSIQKEGLPNICAGFAVDLTAYVLG
jgi:hypothetical protein